MKQKLFLTSAGIVKDIREDFLQLLGKDPKKSFVYFIATAADPEKDKGFVKKDKTQFKEIRRPIFEKATKTTKYPIIALNDTQAVSVEGES